MKTMEQWTEEELIEQRQVDDSKWQDDLFVILDKLKTAYPQSKTHSASVTVKVANQVEVSYSVTIRGRGDS